jgi:hypothetical protein
MNLVLESKNYVIVLTIVNLREQEDIEIGFLEF